MQRHCAGPGMHSIQIASKFFWKARRVRKRRCRWSWRYRSRLRNVCRIQVAKQEREGLRIRGASVLLILALLGACRWSSGWWSLPIAGGLFTVMGFAGALCKHMCNQWRRRTRSNQRKAVSRPKRLWGSHLRGGGEAGGGQCAHQMKAQEAELARALTALMAKFSRQDDANDQPPDDLAPKKGVTSDCSIGDGNSSRGSPKQPSKQKRREMQSSGHWRIARWSTKACGSSQS